MVILVSGCVAFIQPLSIARCPTPDIIIPQVGFVSTIAGKPYQMGDDDGTGNEASFRRPYGLTLDLDGNIFSDTKKMNGKRIKVRQARSAEPYEFCEYDKKLYEEMMKACERHEDVSFYVNPADACKFIKNPVKKAKCIVKKNPHRSLKRLPL